VKRRSPGTKSRAASTTPTSHRQSNATDRQDWHGSQQVSWWSVREFVAPILARVGSWPAAGTPAWCALDDTNPAKQAALYDAAQHWALRIDTCETAMAEASRDISAAADWPAIAREIQQHNDFYAQRPYLKRAVTR
jgi:hypothetical protein